MDQTHREWTDDGARAIRSEGAFIAPWRGNLTWFTVVLRWLFDFHCMQRRENPRLQPETVPRFGVNTFNWVLIKVSMNFRLSVDNIDRPEV